MSNKVFIAKVRSFFEHALYNTAFKRLHAFVFFPSPYLISLMQGQGLSELTVNFFLIFHNFRLDRTLQLFGRGVKKIGYVTGITKN
jgi:hypothetical protein